MILMFKSFRKLLVLSLVCDLRSWTLGSGNQLEINQPGSSDEQLGRLRQHLIATLIYPAC